MSNKKVQIKPRKRKPPATPRRSAPSFTSVLEETAKKVASDLRKKTGIRIRLSRIDRSCLLWRVELSYDDVEGMSWTARLEHVRHVFLREFGHQFYMHFLITCS